MTTDEVRRAYADHVMCACFSATGPGIDPGTPRVIVYPFKEGDGYLYAVWDGFDWDHVLTAIKTGGRINGNMRDAAMVATSALFDYLANRH